MCNTIPNVIAKLGHYELDGFTEKQLLNAFLADGYGIKKAERHVLALKISHGIVPNPQYEDRPNKEVLYISPYCPWHWGCWESVLKDVEISPVRIERDGRITRII